MIKTLKTSTPRRRGLGSWGNRNTNFYFYFPYRDKSKKIRNSLTIRTNSETITLHGREINSLIRLLKKANKI